MNLFSDNLYIRVFSVVKDTRLNWEKAAARLDVMTDEECVQVVCGTLQLYDAPAEIGALDGPEARDRLRVALNDFGDKAECFSSELCDTYILGSVDACDGVIDEYESANLLESSGLLDALFSPSVEVP